MPTKTTPNVIVNFDFISIVFGNSRRLTTGRRGQKATGAVPMPVFNAFCKACNKGEGTLGERVQRFADEIDSIWPDWNRAPKAYSVGQEVKLDFGPRRGGLDTGKVEKVRGTSVTVRFARSGLVRMAADMLDKHNS